MQTLFNVYTYRDFDNRMCFSATYSQRFSFETSRWRNPDSPVKRLLKQWWWWWWYFLANNNTTLLLLLQPFNGLLSRTTWVSRYQKGKTNLDFTGARDSEWQWHQLGHVQVCTSLQTDNHASTPPLCFLQAGSLPAAQPTASKHWRYYVTLHLIMFSLSLHCFDTVGWSSLHVYMRVCVCPSFWLTLSRGVLSTSWRCPSTINCLVDHRYHSLCVLCREGEAVLSNRYDHVWSVPIKSVDILDPMLPSLYKAPVTTTKPTQGTVLYRHDSLAVS